MNDNEMDHAGNEKARGVVEADELALGLDIEKIAREMGLASPAEASGLAYWHEAGMRLRQAVMDFSLKLHEERGYRQVKSPSVAPAFLFEKSGHLDKYAKLMFEAKEWGEPSALDEPSLSRLMLRPMSCPNHIAMYQSRRRSAAELPWRVFEFGEVFRNEPSGSLAFLLRQRQFCQDDAHVVCEIGHVGELAMGWLGMARAACAWMGCGEPQMRLATRPMDKMGSEQSWDLAEALLGKELAASGMPWSLAQGDGAFYGPKIELGLRDRLGRSWQLGVFQLDMNLPQRFGLRADGRGNDAPLALVHHAVFGSVERAIGVMLACRGKDLAPLVHPNALAILAVSEKHMEASRRFESEARRIIGARAELIMWNDPLAVKIAKAKQAGWLRICVIGAQEELAGAGGAPKANLNGIMVDPRRACDGLARAGFFEANDSWKNSVS